MRRDGRVRGRTHRRNPTRRRWRSYHHSHGGGDRIRPGQGHRRRAAAARDLVQARAPRPDDPVRPQRRGQDDAAADARRRGLGRLRRARARQGRQGRAARPAAAARAGAVAARLRRSRARASWWRSRASWPALEQAMAAGAHDEATLDRYAEAQARLEHAGGYSWRERALATLHGLGFRDDADLDRPLRDVLRRRADARLAGAGAGRRPRPAAARRADQPPRHRVAGVARAAPGRPRRRDRAGRPRPLVPGGGRHLGARARGGRGQVLRRPLARLAPGEGGPGAGAGPRDRAPAGRDRAARAVRDPLSRRDPRAPGAVAGQAAGEDRPRSTRDPARRRRRSSSPSSRPSAAAGWCSSSRTRSWRPGTSTLLARRRAVARARRARLAGRAQRRRQDDADRDAGRPPRARRAASSDRPQREDRLPLPARRGADGGDGPDGARGDAARHRADPGQGAGAARPVPVLRRGGREAARRPLRRRAPPAVAGDPGPLRAPTC